MFNSFDLSETLDKLVDKLSGWGEGFILKAPNFVIALLVFILFWQIGKYFGRFLKKCTSKESCSRIYKSNYCQNFIYCYCSNWIFYCSWHPRFRQSSHLCPCRCRCYRSGYWSCPSRNFKQHILRNHSFIFAKY